MKTLQVVKVPSQVQGSGYRIAERKNNKFVGFLSMSFKTKKEADKFIRESKSNNLTKFF